MRFFAALVSNGQTGKRANGQIAKIGKSDQSIDCLRFEVDMIIISTRYTTDLTWSDNRSTYVTWKIYHQAVYKVYTHESWIPLHLDFIEKLFIFWSPSVHSCRLPVVVSIFNLKWNVNWICNYCFCISIFFFLRFSFSNRQEIDRLIERICLVFWIGTGLRLKGMKKRSWMVFKIDADDGEIHGLSYLFLCLIIIIGQ